MAAFLVASCTAEVEGPSATGAPVAAVTVPVATTLPAPEAMARFRACLEERGVVIEEVPVDARGRPRLELVMAAIDLADPDVAAAVTRCADLLTRGPLDLIGDEALRELVIRRLEEYRDCMVSRGVVGFPDPVPGFVGIGPPFPLAEIPYSDPELPGAAEACRGALLEVESLPGDP